MSLGPDHAGDLQLADLVVHPDLLAAVDRHVAVGQDLGDQGGDLQLDLLAAADRAGAAGRGGWSRNRSGCSDRPPRAARHPGWTRSPGSRAAPPLRNCCGRAPIRCFSVRLVVDLDHDGQNVADGARPLVPEEARGRPAATASSPGARPPAAPASAGGRACILLGLDRVLDRRQRRGGTDVHDPLASVAGGQRERRGGEQDGGRQPLSGWQVRWRTGTRGRGEPWRGFRRRNRRKAVG